MKKGSPKATLRFCGSFTLLTERHTIPDQLNRQSQYIGNNSAVQSLKMARSTSSELNTMTWRLGLDIGTNSIGWAALALAGARPKPAAIMSSGVRIFSDGRNPRDRQSNAVARRLPRQQRRMRDRYLNRRPPFHGLDGPSGPDARGHCCEEGPWRNSIRGFCESRGLDEKLTLHELGRALFHLQQRRGFKSNRKTDRGDRRRNRKNHGRRQCADGQDGNSRSPHTWASFSRGPG